MAQPKLKEDSQLYECICESTSHILCVYSDRQTDTTVMDFNLNHYLPFHKRALLAFLYLFGFARRGWSMYDCIILDSEKRQKLIEHLQSEQARSVS